MRVAAALLRPGRLILLGLLVAAIVAGVVFGPWIHAQARAVGIIATAYETPVLSWVTRKVTKEPKLADTRLADVPTTLIRPGGDGPWPTLLLLNGATEAGRRDPDVIGVAIGLARVGYLVAVPDMPALLAGDVTADALERALVAARALAASSEARDGRLGIVGLGLGGTFGLLVAEDPALAGRVSTVLAVTPVVDLVELGRLATTGYHRVAEGYAKRTVPIRLRRAIENAVVEALPAGPEKTLVQEAIARGVGGSDPLAALKQIPDGVLDQEAQAIVDLLVNDDPRRYDALYDRLPDEVRATIQRLSPIEGVERLRAPVEIATSASDPYVPLAQARALERASSLVRVTVADAFSATGGKPTISDAGSFLELDRLIVRSLRRAAD